MASPAAWATWACRASDQPPPRVPSSVLFAPPVNRLITELSRLPGIGQRTAQRLAFYLLSVPPEDALPLADAIREVKESVGQCEVCFNLAVESTCRICQDERREGQVICVVEQPSDVIPIERTNEFRGRYHVLGGALSPIDGVDPEDLRLAELVTRVEGGGIREVVIGLASGLPMGSDLEYADEVTLGNAFKGRRDL